MHIKINNLDKVNELFQSMPDAANDALRIAIRRGMRDIVVHARQHHRFTSRSGMLERSITSEYKEGQGRVFLDLAVAPYAAYVHEGTKQHEIKPKDKKALRWSNNGSFIFAKKVTHPGTKSDQFLYKAANAVKANFQKYLSEEIMRAVMKK